MLTRLLTGFKNERKKLSKRAAGSMSSYRWRRTQIGHRTDYGSSAFSLLAFNRNRMAQSSFESSSISFSRDESSRGSKDDISSVPHLQTSRSIHYCVKSTSANRQLPTRKRRRSAILISSSIAARLSSSSSPSSMCFYCFGIFNRLRASDQGRGTSRLEPFLNWIWLVIKSIG